LWAHGVVDANVTVEQVVRRDGHSAVMKDLATMAIDLAKNRTASGFAFGICSDPTRAWVATVPAGMPLTVADSMITVPDTKPFCRQVEVHHVASDTGHATPLVPQNGVINTKSLAKGTLSFTCSPRLPVWQGPVLWFLAPIGGGPGSDPPARDSLTQFTQPEHKIANWVNAIRSEQHLPPLQHEREGELQSAVLSLSLQPTLTHDQRKIDSTHRHLKGSYVFQGEDRVAGSDIATMAWLLWNSPRHRDLLLRPDSNTIAINVKKRHGQLYAVLLVAKKE
jgi:hypothetical protein